MNQAKRDRNAGYGDEPPPYNPLYYGQNSYTGMSYQVGKGNISVVSPPGSYLDPAEGQAAIGHWQQPGESPAHGLPGSEEKGFSDAVIRRGFIRKVYLILMIQLLVTVGIICAFLYWRPLKEWTLSTYWFTYFSMVTLLMLIVAFSCCGGIFRRVPLNFIALGLFTVTEGLMLGSATVFFKAEAILWAVGATSLVAFSLTVFAMQSKWDFTTAYGTLWVSTWSLISLALLCAILRTQYLNILYACLGTLLFSIYLVYDTQLILGGKHRKHEISPEEYVFAALNLYADIIALFVLLLQLNVCR